MDKLTIEQIKEINRNFYASYANDFSMTRQSAWPGWDRVVENIQSALNGNNGLRVLDIGCGNGRFYDFLIRNFSDTIKNRGHKANNASSRESSPLNIKYVGFDESTELIKTAKQKFPKTNFIVSDFYTDFSDLGRFDAAVCFGIMHHIPYEKVESVLKKAANSVGDNGLLMATFWVRTPDPNQIAEIFSDQEYLRIWNKNKNSVRFVHIFNEKEVDQLADFVTLLGFTETNRYFSDGKSGKDNIYVIWKRK